MRFSRVPLRASGVQGYFKIGGEKDDKRIESSQKGRYTNVVGNVVAGRDARLVFRDNGGEGKILKPLTYKDWKEFYS